jgi:hypothetical protein
MNFTFLAYGIINHTLVFQISNILGIIFILLPIYLILSIYIHARKNFYGVSRLNETIVYELSDNYCKISGESFNTEFTWDKTFRIQILQEWVLIYSSKNIAHFIPVSAFKSSQLEEFIKFLKARHSD